MAPDPRDIAALAPDEAPSPISRTPLVGFSMLSFAPGWRSTAAARHSGCFVTSGRAAIYWALKLAGVRSGDAVLVPTYHCPTLVAPVTAIGARPVFYPIVAPGLPDLERIDGDALAGSRVVIVPQLFGLPLDLSPVREWCDRHGIAMIEDCAHSLFGRAGDRMAGEWGDYAALSLTKFLPVGELGFVFSSRREVPHLDLRPASLRWQVKGVLDPLEVAARHHRLGWIGRGIGVLARLRSRGDGRSAGRAARRGGRDAVEQAMADCNMSRIADAPAVAGRIVASRSDYNAIAARRRYNFDRMVELLARYPLGRPLVTVAPRDSGPYVLPVLVEEPETLYPAMRNLGFPVYRWDRVWPGTPSADGDLATSWRHRMLQIPVHQSYTDRDFERVADMLKHLMSAAATTH